MVLAESYAALGNEAEVDRLLPLAHAIFPDHPEHDLNFTYAPVNRYTLTNHEVLLHLHLHRPRQA